MGFLFLEGNIVLKIPSNIIQSFPYLFSVAAGAVDGVKIIKKFGQNPAVDSTATIWDEGGIYEYLTSAQNVSIASTSANDTELGTGARSVRVSGLDENWLEKDEVVTLNGQTPVVISGQYIRIFRMEVLSAGSTGSGEGTIRSGIGTFTAGVPSQTLAAINNGLNQTLMAMYTVPDDKVAIFGEFFANSGKSSEVNVDSFTREFGSVFRIKRRVGLFESSFFVTNSFPFVNMPRDDIEIRATASVSSTPIAAGFDIMLIDKDKIFGR